MPHPSLAIFGYSEAAMFLRGSPRRDIAGIISIHGSREFGVEALRIPRLDLTFDDAEIGVPGDMLSLQRVMARRRWCEQNGLTEVPPTEEDAAAIISFAASFRATTGTVLCHCGGGMSRAPAAALICLAVWRGAGTEEACVAEIRGLRQGAVPHVGIVRFADHLLLRNGHLVAALSESAAHRRVP